MSKTLITRKNLHEFIDDQCLCLIQGMILTPGAADLAKKEGIQVIHKKGQTPSTDIEDRIIRILKSEFNITDERTTTLVIEAVISRI